jgi:hypothetical protein
MTFEFVGPGTVRQGLATVLKGAADAVRGHRGGRQHQGDYSSGLQGNALWTPEQRYGGNQQTRSVGVALVAAWERARASGRRTIPSDASRRKMLWDTMGRPK